MFPLGSVLAGIARSTNAFITFRAVRSVGAGGLMVGARSIIGEVTSPRYRGRYLSMLAPLIGVGTVLWPLLGGCFTEQLNWRWIFHINIPLGAVALTVVILVPRGEAAGNRAQRRGGGELRSPGERRAHSCERRAGGDLVGRHPDGRHPVGNLAGRDHGDDHRLGGHGGDRRCTRPPARDRPAAGRIASRPSPLWTFPQPVDYGADLPGAAG
ncbi:Major Facilitator Superfamily protein [Actinopolyspora mzabensis]|uniref:Major Facilitator Superfamily protein n=1 Tax=Actinopolyspora mzabensis TaxID=995066 RepID=A0A1G9DEC0_ACTMZ|nr:Major Facilitator Superfamily protein [Actinopolyspora mzabensis]